MNGGHFAWCILTILIYVNADETTIENDVVTLPTNQFSQDSNNGNTKLDIRLGVMGFDGQGPPFQMKYLGAAAPMAARDINSNSTILPNHTIILHMLMGGGCNKKLGLGDVVTLVRDMQVSRNSFCYEKCIIQLADSLYN